MKWVSFQEYVNYVRKPIIAPMCFSARVRQNLKTLSRRYEAEVDWAAFEELYRRRAEGEDIKASRDLQRNFQHPETDVEHRTAAYITQYLQAKRSEWESSVFMQKRRVPKRRNRSRSAKRKRPVKTSASARRRRKSSLTVLPIYVGPSLTARTHVSFLSAMHRC